MLSLGIELEVIHFTTVGNGRTYTAPGIQDGPMPIVIYGMHVGFT